MKIWRRQTSDPCGYLGKASLGRSNSSCKGLKVGMCLAHPRNVEEVTVTVME